MGQTVKRMHRIDDPLGEHRTANATDSRVHEVYSGKRSASASISTFQRGSRSPFTTTIVKAG